MEVTRSTHGYAGPNRGEDEEEEEEDEDEFFLEGAGGGSRLGLRLESSTKVTRPKPCASGR